jgi:copper chaperone CopZ
MQRVTFTIPNMHCPACVIHLQELEDELPGISFIQASYRTQRMEVEYDESLVSEAEIRQSVGKLGYEIA